MGPLADCQIAAFKMFVFVCEGSGCKAKKLVLGNEAPIISGTDSDDFS